MPSNTVQHRLRRLANRIGTDTISRLIDVPEPQIKAVIAGNAPSGELSIILSIIEQMED